jgi:protein Tex
MNDHAAQTHPFSALIAGMLHLPEGAVRQIIRLLEDGATVPFIARYRKEQAGGLDETVIVQVRQWLQRFGEMAERKETIRHAMAEAGALTPEMARTLADCWDPTLLEDLYLPYKKKRKTRASLARDRGLDPLADLLLGFRTGDPRRAATAFIGPEVPDAEAALAGARDIIAERFAEDARARETLRHLLGRDGLLRSRAGKQEGPDKDKYRDYFDFEEPIARIPSHRYLAIRRGEKAGFLQVKLTLPDEDSALFRLIRPFIRHEGACAVQVREAIADGFRRLLFPSLENEWHQRLQESREDDAIGVFGANLRELLLAPPLGAKAVLALDPGFRSGCKLVALDPTGALIAYQTIFPHPPQGQTAAATATMQEWVSRYQPTAIAVGDGTAGRETMEWLEKLDLEPPPTLYLVSESGASVYSASEIAREEFPDLDIHYRGAASIGRRLMDPLAELVKIDPKSIGVGQYQHDVHQGKLRQALDDTTTLAVNRVGVQLNTASAPLLTFVAGIGPVLAQNIVRYRREQGPFRSRSALKKVPRLGEKAFEQCAGFLRVRESGHPLDNTGIHPERYALVERIAADQGLPVAKLLRNTEALERIPWANYQDAGTGMPTLEDIRRELEKPGLDPRGEARAFAFDPRVRSIQDLYPGQRLPGLVSNITPFGAFVQLGIKQDGLVHISNMADRFIRHPSEVLRLRQEVEVRVLKVDVERGRIDLSLKAES